MNRIPQPPTQNGANRLNYSAGLKPLNTASKSPRYSNAPASPFVTILCVINCILSLATPIMAVIAAMNGLQRLLMANLSQLDTATTRFIDDISFDTHAILTLFDKLSMFKTALSQLGAGGKLLVAGLVIFIIATIIFVFSCFSSRFAPAFCKATLMVGAGVVVIGTGLSFYGFSSLLEIITIPAPETYADYIVLGGGIVMIFSSILAFVLIRPMKKHPYTYS